MEFTGQGIVDERSLATAVQGALAKQPVTDLHTHCYAPLFGASPKTGGLLLWGIDELVTYHYLVAEVFRVVPATELPYEKFWKMSKREQGDHIWEQLFVRRTPISEACRGVLTTLKLLGLDPNERTLEPYRKWFGQQNADGYVDLVMRVANVDQITMTNGVFDDHERGIWERDPQVGQDARFKAVLRIDPLLRDWPGACRKMTAWGYKTSEDFSGQTISEIKRFLGDWLDKMRAIYIATSLPPEFRYPAPGSPAPGSAASDKFIEQCLMPVCAERKLPWALMIGARLQVNPALKDAGDVVGKADVVSVVNLCRAFGGNKFLVTMLSRENQHELCVAARKFGNLMVFGCWWFLNNPSLIEELTRMRLELLGTSFIPQHSDARVLDQLLYKWEHSRGVIGKVLADKYADLMRAGRRVSREDIQRDAAALLRENFRDFGAR